MTDKHKRQQQINNFTWFAFRKGAYKANYSKLKEYCYTLIKMADQDTAGQGENKSKDIDWSLLNPIIMGVVIEACALVLSREYE